MGQLREPKYQITAAYGHFGRKPYTENGMKFFEWENAMDLSKYTAMTSAKVAEELPPEVGGLRYSQIFAASTALVTSFWLPCKSWRPRWRLQTVFLGIPFLPFSVFFGSRRVSYLIFNGVF